MIDVKTHALPTSARFSWTRLRRRPWIIPLAAVTVWFLVRQVAPYLNEATAPLMPHQGFSAYYAILMVHIFAGSIVMLITVGQVWTTIRVRWPAVHRWAGRVYVVTTAVGGAAGLVILPFAPAPGKIGAAVAVLSWIATSAIGFRAARLRRWDAHRRWMLYSFAIVMNNVWGVVLVMIGRSFVTDFTYLGEGSRWLGLVIDLMLVRWWLNYTANRTIRLAGSTPEHQLVTDIRPAAPLLLPAGGPVHGG